LEGTPVGHLVQPPCQSRVSYRSLWRTVSHERNLTLGQRQSMRSPPPEDEGVTDELITTPIPHPPVMLRGRR